VIKGLLKDEAWGTLAMAIGHTIFAAKPVELRAHRKCSVAQDRLSCVVEKKAVHGWVDVVALCICPFLEKVARTQAPKSVIIGNDGAKP
jgi:hypothetical protein